MILILLTLTQLSARSEAGIIYYTDFDCDDGEYNPVVGSDTSNATVALSTDTAYSGTQSCKINITSSSGYVIGYMTGSDTASPAEFWARVRIYITSGFLATLGTNGDEARLFWGLDSSYSNATFMFMVYYDDGQKAYFMGNEWGINDSGTLAEWGITADTWLTVKVHYVQHASSGVLSLYINNVLVSENTSEDTDINTAMFIIGNDWGTAGVTGAIYYDDFVISTEDITDGMPYEHSYGFVQ